MKAKKDRERLEKQFMDEMVTPKIPKDFNNEFEKYDKEMEARMWKGVVISVIILIVAFFVALIAQK